MLYLTILPCVSLVPHVQVDVILILRCPKSVRNQLLEAQFCFDFVSVKLFFLARHREILTR